MEGFKITDILQRGSAVKTQLPNSINWIPNVVFDTYSDKDEVGVIFDNRYDNFVIFVGDEIKLNYADGNVQYSMETTITSIRLEAVRIMTLKINSIKKIPNLRRYERYSVNYGANIFSFENPDGIFGVITNISLCGVAFITRDTFLEDDVVSISILFPSSRFIVDARIIRHNETEKGIEYGAEFIRQDENAKDELNRVLEDIKEREDRLSRIVVGGSRYY
ncbi:MAG: PilZ domain-containing protein [Clostridiales bacterium]|nr:PilZ domain-containing protein [Clostridiales bacterium]